MRLLDQRQSADSGAYADADLLAHFPVEIYAAVFQGVNAGSKAVMDEGVEASGFLGRKPLRDLEPLGVG